MSTQAPQLPQYQPPSGGMPSFLPANFGTMNAQASAADLASLQASQSYFRQQYPQLYGSQQTFLNNLNTQMSGNVPPQMQNLMARSGLTNALSSTGAWSLGGGTSGMANIARNLGIDQMSYQNQVLNQFQMANAMFKPPQIGLTGADAAQTYLSNIAGQNNWNMSNYAMQVQQAQYQAGLGAQQAALNANAANATTATAVGGATTALSVAAIAAFCHVAREAYGFNDPRWLRFRFWLVTQAPGAFRKLYVKYGFAFSQLLRHNAWLKPLVRGLMDLTIKESPYIPFALC